MPEYIPLSVPDLRGKEEEYVLDCIRSGWISSVGSYVTRFEERFAEYVGAKHAVAVVNGTSALHLSLLISGVGPNDLVLVPGITFIAPVNTVTYVGAEPVFVDMNPQTLGMDPGSVRTFLQEQCEKCDRQTIHRETGKRVAAMVPVHLYGHACTMRELIDLAAEYDLTVIEDCAEGIACKAHGQHVGTFARIGCFSFNGNKILTTGGGGMIVTDDEALARHARHLSTQAKADELNYVHDEIGYNYRMTNVLAAIGLAQLERADEMVQRKQAIHEQYRSAWGDEDPELFTAQPWCDSNYWMALLHVGAGKVDAFIRHFADRSIQARPIWKPCHEQIMYESCLCTPLPQSEAFARETVAIPCSQTMSDNDVDRVIDAVRTWQ